MRNKTHTATRGPLTLLGVGALAALWGWGCRGGGTSEEEWTRRLNEANDKVVSCRNDVSELKSQNAELKHKLAEALAAPARMQLTDPDILNLIAEIRSKRGAAEEGDIVLGKGDLNPKEAGRVVKQGAQALQRCYERALKKNTALQMQTGLSVMLEITVKPTGTVKTMSLAPQVDGEMVECVRSTVTRWKFPPFSGEPVVVAQKLTLTPKS
ncbi:MAG: AgmX/PglI C-terminal domain-containing protein [Polyangia bacterium]